MIVVADPPRCAQGPDPLQARFLALVPRIESHARIYFRGLRCAHAREEAVAETVALAWQWFRRLVERGKDAAMFVGGFAFLAALTVKSGRRLCGQEPARDVLSPLAQRRHSFTVAKLPDGATLAGTPAEEALHDNTRTPPPEQAAFRLDFPRWLGTRTDRECRLVADLMVGERTGDLARKYGVSPGRISQLRREFAQDWRRFCGDPVAREASPAACAA
jgi:hypothetical protein